MFYVYILFSSSLEKYYVGYTENVSIRLNQHNAGKGNYTSKGVPWILITIVECTSRSSAAQLELKIKKRGIKRYLQDQGLV
ncbi:putative endonuclease [Lacibacter cauensis]|uniref:Putative endonuclease n=1 Tax=Lacibacter cauensis TaxID=510947 RepID=A0A562SVY1_9BACT|nr:GIY-YIG nuclease family protein [Lacibacter cauensis]TWI85449.1 putative endonuclease [Lacibacter cauensis]